MLIHWLEQEQGEGRFTSSFFKNDEQDNELIVYIISDWQDSKECAEKCVAAFNNLPESTIYEICSKLMHCAQQSCIEENVELSPLKNPLDILNHCWFVALYVDIKNKDDAPAYAVEGEGWGENIGFVIRDNQVVYVGTEYFDYMQNAE